MGLFEKFQAAGLPVISVDETGGVAMRAMTPEQMLIMQDIILEHFRPNDWNEELNIRLYKSEFRDEFISMVNRLEQIINSGTIPFTQAGFNQVVQAVKDDALYSKRILNFLKRLI